MLDMGFIHDVKVITKLPAKGKRFFSATMPPEIQKLADVLLTSPAKVEVTPVSSTAEAIDQSLYFVEKKINHPCCFIFEQQFHQLRSCIYPYQTSVPIK